MRRWPLPLPLPLLLVAALASLAVCTLTTAKADANADRRALQQQRSALDAQLVRDVAVCEARFAVNACLDDVRARFSATVKPLTATLEALDTRERNERAAAQKERVAERQREFAADEGRRRTQALLVPEVARSADLAASTPVRTPRAADPEARATQLRRQAVADAQTARSNRDQLAARQHQQQLRVLDQQQRAEARARSGKIPSAALPLPTQAEVAAAVAAASSASRH